jgi:hypothetical protein
MRISLSDTLCGRETAKAMTWAMSSAVEEDLGRGHRAEPVGLDHLALLGGDAVGAAREQRYVVAVGGQRTGGGLAETRRGAGDDRDADGVGPRAHWALL